MLSCCQHGEEKEVEERRRAGPVRRLGGGLSEVNRVGGREREVVEG